MKVKISAGFSGVIATGSYENARPSYGVEIEFDVAPEEYQGDELARFIESKQKSLQEVCYGRFKQDEETQTIEKINRQRADFHWITLPSGRLVPSVTSIIGFDDDYFVSIEELSQYASQSNLAHAQVAHFIADNKWVEAKELKECWPDLVVVSKGSLKLSTSGWDFPAFLEKFPIKKMLNAKQSYNEEHLYGGTPDFEGIPVGWNKIKGYEDVQEVPTVFDIKRTKNKLKNGKQLAGYSRMVAYRHVKQGITIELNDKTQQGWSKPDFFSEDDLQGYFNTFLRDREAFKKRFGV